MSISSKKLKSNLIKFKPYELTFFHEHGLSLNHSYTEHLDLNDLRNAAIKEITITNYFPLSKINIKKLTELFSNINIEIVNLQFFYYTRNSYLLLFSKLLRKNTTIKEINLEFYKEKIITGTKKQLWIILLNTISNRLIKISNTASLNDTDINRLLFSNSNIKEIFLNNFEEKYKDEYSNIVKYILSSDNKLEELSLFPNNLNIPPQFFDYISKSERKLELNTLILNMTSLENNLIMIEKAYLFKIETIRIEYKNNSKQVIHHLFLLSNNPLNTVKRIIIENEQKDFMQIASELLRFNKYDIPKIPMLFIDGYREVSLNSNKLVNKYNVTSLYENSKLINNTEYYFRIIFREKSIDEASFTEFLYCLFNNPNRIRSLTVGYNELNDLLGKSYPNEIIKNTLNIVNKLKEIYQRFKLNFIYSKRMENKELTLYFNNYSPELNFFYFTILEIIIDMKINIDILRLNNCPINELVEFLNKNKTLKCLNKILIVIKKIDKENIENINTLCQFSQMIKGKILIKFAEELDLKKESTKIDLIDLYLQHLNHNFIDFSFSCNSNPFINQENCFKDFKIATKYIESNKDFQRLYNSRNNDCFKNINIRDLKLYFLNFNNIKILYDLFSFFKEYNYVLNRICFECLWHPEVNILRKLNSFLIETLLCTKYGDKNINTSRFMICYPKLKKKDKRCLTLHNVSIIESIFY